MTEPERTHPRASRPGLILFAIYVVFYAAFVLLSAFSPATMKMDIGGVNLAIVYGFGLIILAFVLAMIYMFLTRGDSREGRA